ncbi:MAG: hypothetical protein PVF45_02165, partial [Anaerolineae bacterium]
MASALDKLLKILQLEQEQGHRDKAVIGGLARFANNWRQQALRETDDTAWVDLVAEHMQAYSQWTTRGERRDNLETLRTILQAKARGEEIPAHVRRALPARPAPAPPQREQVHVTAPAPDRPVERPLRVQRRPAAAKRPVAERKQDAGLDSPITTLTGVGPVQARRLGRL